MSDLDCKVLDHLIQGVAPTLENNTSPLASCLVASKDNIVCGSKLDCLRKETYATSSKVCTLVRLERHHILRPKRLKGQYLYIYEP